MFGDADVVVDCATDVRDALDRVAGEREQVLTKRQTVERFERRVWKLAARSVCPSIGTTRATTYGTTPVAATIRRDDAVDEGRRRVRELFAETIRPHSVSGVSESEPFVVTIREEFGPGITTAFSPDTGSRFTLAVKEAVVSAVAERQRDLDGTCRTLDGKKRLFQAAFVVLDEYEDWVARADETPFLELGLDVLRRRHETFANHHEACGRLTRERQ